MTASRTGSPPRPARTAVHPVPERGAALLRAGYPYLLRLRREWQAPTLELRLLGRRTTVLSGAQGVALFYDEAIMRRRGALPRPLLHLLFGRGAVHGLDDLEHKHRKALFLRLLTPAAADEIAATAAQLWQARPAERPLDPVAAFDDAVEVHCAAVCRWAGVPAALVDRRLGGDLAAIVDGFGSVGARQLRAQRARRRVNRWARRLVRRVRRREVTVDTERALAIIAAATESNGKPLPARVAAVELVNVLRPTVAVAYFVAFAAHALRTRPDLRDRLAAPDDTAVEAFAHELRRYYPFVPALAACVSRPVSFQGRPLPAGRRVLLDVYGTLHDPDLWPDPERFDLDRFMVGEPPADRYVPQGGGESIGHRCPGERTTIELLKVAARHLVAQPVGDRPAGEIPLNRLPTRPLAKE